MLTRALIAALAALLFFVLTAVSIASGRDAHDDPLVNLFSFLQIASLLVTFVMTGTALVGRPGHRPRAIGAARGLGVGILLAVALAAVFTAVCRSLPSE